MVTSINSYNKVNGTSFDIDIRFEVCTHFEVGTIFNSGTCFEVDTHFEVSTNFKMFEVVLISYSTLIQISGLIIRQISPHNRTRIYCVFVLNLSLVIVRRTQFLYYPIIASTQTRSC